MGKRVRNLTKIPYWQCTCPSQSAHLLGTFGHGSISIPPFRAQNYTTIRLLTLCVKFDGIWRRTPELEHLPWTAFIRCVWKILSPIKAPFAKKMLLFWSLHFCLLSSTKPKTKKKDHHKILASRTIRSFLREKNYGSFFSIDLCLILLGDWFAFIHHSIQKCSDVLTIRQPFFIRNILIHK